MGVYEEFKKPPRDFAPLFFWFFNGDLHAEALESQVREMADKGAAGGFMHARHGQRVPYLSEQWMERVDAVIRQARKSGVQAWLYDEDNWPSGSASEKVTEKRPEWQSHYLRYEFLEAGESLPEFLEDEELIKVFMIEGRGQSPRNYRNLSISIPLDQRIQLLSPEERLLIFSVGRNRYVDVLNPAAIQRFIELTHDAYYKRFGRDFGKTVPGIFTDEVTLMNVWGKLPRRSFPYTPGFEERIIEHWDCTFEQMLPHLVMDFGPESSAMRIKFFETLLKLYIDAFFEPIGRWCAAHRAALTGHVLSEEPLFSSVRHQADVFPLYAEMQIPGVDHLGVEIEGIHHKIASSVAHVWGRPRVMSEAFGACGWGVDLNDKRNALDWQITQGVNMFCVHGAYYTVRGKRKRENPPSEFIQEPWWKYYGAWSDYVSRLCSLFARGRHCAPALVPFPVRSAWAQYRPDPPPAFHRLERNLFLLAEALGAAQYDFDFVDEDVMVDFGIKSGRVASNYETYSMIVLPSAWVWNVEAFEWIRRAMKAGVPVLQIGTPARWLWRRNRLEGVDAEDWGAISAVSIREVRNREQFRARLEQCAPPDLWVDGEQPGQVRYLLRHDGRKKYFLVHNASTRDNRLSLKFNETGRLSEWDPWTGERSLLTKRITPNKTWDGIVAAESSRVFVIEKEMGKTSIPVLKPGQKGRKVAMADPWRMSRLEPNCLVCQDWRVRIPGQKQFRVLTPRLPVRIQSALEPLEVINPPSAEYRCRFWIKEMPKTLELVIEPIEAPFQVFFNGERIELNLGIERDPEFMWAPILDLAQPGRNEIVLKADYRKVKFDMPDYLNRLTVDLVPEPPRLFGDFRCVDMARTLGIAADIGAEDAAPKSWTELGYPHFSGTMSYRTRFALRKEWLGGRHRFVLELPGVKNLAEVHVNGKYAGLKMIGPWEMELGEDLLKSGKNDLELRVTNTAANWLLGDPKESGLLQAPTLRLDKL